MAQLIVPQHETSQMDRQTLRVSAMLLGVGFVVSFGAGLLHPSREPPNNHIETFAEYASSASWTAVHLAQFVGLAAIIAGLLALYIALDLRLGAAALVARLAAVAAFAALALYGVLQAIDGVALKQAVDAWANAPEAEKPARFATAEALRWLEWGTRSYHSFLFGLSLLGFGSAIASTARTPRAIGYLMMLSGLAYLAQAWVLGSEGFSANNTIPTLSGYLFVLAWTIWILAVAWRTKGVGAGSASSEHGN